MEFTLVGILIAFVALTFFLLGRFHISHRPSDVNLYAQVNRAIVNSSRYGVIHTDVRGVIKTFNPAAENMLGYKASEVLNRLNPTIFHDQDEVVQRSKELGVAPDFEVFVLQCREQRQPEVREWTYIRQDKSKFKVMLSVSALWNENNQLIGYVGIFEDVTSLNEWKKAQEMKQVFLANITHELRTPMNGVLGLLDLLNQQMPPEQFDYYIRLMKTSGATLLDLINQILDFSKIEGNHIQLRKDHVHLKAILADVVGVFKIQATAQHLRFEEHDHFPENIEIEIDGLRFKQIIFNLLSNALKFTTEGKIIIDIKVKDDLLSLSISDTGIGIPKEKQQKLFEPFNQLDQSMTRNYGGTGLGLSIAKRLVHLMGGELQLNSDLGKGSTFTFSIPIKVLGESPIQGQHSLTPLNTFKIEAQVLVVEDNDINQIVIKEILTSLGVSVSLAPNGEEAIKMMKNNHYDIVFMDIQMPIMDGIAATRKWRKIDVEPPIVALTANTSDLDIHNCMEAGMNYFLPKPVNRDMLRECLLTFLGKKDA